MYNQQLVNISFTAGYNMVGPTLPHSGNSSRQFTQGNWLQGVLLVMGSWCTVLAAGALAPVLPQIGGAFPNTSAIDFKVGLLATAPALGVALSAIPLGRLADRIGLSLVLLSGLLLYGVAGVLPFFSLQSIEAIIGTRLLVGLGEAAVMLTSTAMLGLFFSGASRARWIAAQAVSANILGIAILLGGGILGLYGWRAPFLVYGFALLLLVPCSLLLPRLPAFSQQRDDSAKLGSKGLVALVVQSCALIAWSTIGLTVILFQLPFILIERGATNSATIGVCLAVGAIGIASGAAAGGVLARVSTSRRLIIAFTLMGAGFIALSMVHEMGVTTLFAAVAGLGSGLTIPTLLSRLLGATPPSASGSVTGWWIAATFAAQFANPQIFTLLRSLTGTRSSSITVFGIATLLLAIALVLRASSVNALDRART